MARETFLLTSVSGIDWSMIEDENGTSFAATQDLTEVLDRNKAMRNHNDGYTADRSMRRVGHLPDILIELWKNTEGWDARQSWDPDVRKKIVQKLNDPDYAFLRTADGQLGFSNGVMR